LRVASFPTATVGFDVALSARFGGRGGFGVGDGLLIIDECLGLHVLLYILRILSEKVERNLGFPGIFWGPGQGPD
jgi:hypothetical protein